MMTIMPHNHSMWAVIGIYTGREDNIFWRRLPDGSGKVEAAGAQALCERDAAPLRPAIIPPVTNPIPPPDRRDSRVRRRFLRSPPQERVGPGNAAGRTIRSRARS